MFADKSELRIWAKKKRSMQNMRNESFEIRQKLLNTDVYKSARDVMIFYPLKDEVDLLPLLEDKTKNFYLPRINGESLLCCPYSAGDELCLSCFNTKEPVTDSVDSSLPDLIIVPALAVDKKNYRLGYGGGFYDRFLGSLNKSTANYNSMVCISKELIVDTVFPEEFDIPVDFVVSN